MRKSQLTLITCLTLAGAACSSGPDKGSGTTGGSTTSALSGGSTGATTGGASSGTSSGGGAGASATGATTGPAGPDFALSVNPNLVVLPEGGSQTVQVNIQRDAGGSPDTDQLYFALISDGGINALFNPSEAGGDATALTVAVDLSVPPGTYPLTVNASSATNPQSAHDTTFTLRVSSGQITTLLVDNDASANNADGGGLPSPSDSLFAQLLQSNGILYNTFVVSSTGPDTFDGVALDNYKTIVWYTGANNNQVANGCLTSFQEQYLQLWLDEGGKQLLMFSPYLVQDLGPVQFWAEQPSDQFLLLYVGAQGCDQNPQQLFNGQSFVATGVDGTAFGALDGGEDGGALFDIAPTPISDTVGVINPGDGGAIALVTVAADELAVGAPQDLPTAVMNPHAGQAGTSAVIFVGLPIEDIQASGSGSPQTFFNDLQQSLP